jgi:hypothetical protein
MIPGRIETAASGANVAWEVVDFQVPEERAIDDKLGRFSRSWFLRGSNMDVPVCLSIDYPFRAGHDLTICYRSAGWQMLDDDLITIDLPNGEKDYYVRATFRKPDGQHALLFFSMVDEYGKVQIPRFRASENALQNRLRRLREMLQRKQTDIRYQVQVFAQAYSIINSNESEHLRQLFLTTRTRVTQAYLSINQGGK